MMRRFVAVSLQLAAVMSVVIAIVTSMFCSDILQMLSLIHILNKNQVKVTMQYPSRRVSRFSAPLLQISKTPPTNDSPCIGGITFY